MLNAEEWLMSIRGINFEIKGLRISYRDALERASSTTSTPVGERVMYTPKNSNEENMVDVSEYAMILKKLIVKKERILKEAIEIIERVGNAKQRTLLRFYYIEAYSWEEVAERLGLSTRHVSGYLKEQAIEKIEKMRERSAL